MLEVVASSVRAPTAFPGGLSRVVTLPAVPTRSAAGLSQPSASPRPLLMDPSSPSPALSVALAVLAVLLALTGFGIYTAFGPPSRRLSDPFDDHDD